MTKETIPRWIINYSVPALVFLSIMHAYLDVILETSFTETRNHVLSKDKPEQRMNRCIFFLILYLLHTHILKSSDKLFFYCMPNIKEAIYSSLILWLVNSDSANLYLSQLKKEWDLQWS